MTAESITRRDDEPRIANLAADFASPLPNVTRGPTKPATAADPAALSAIGPLVPGPLGPLVTRIDLGQPVADHLKSRWGADETGTFRCPLPGHTGTARLIVQDGDLRLGCCSGHWRSLGEVRMAEAYGRVKWQPTNIEIAIWTRRLAYEAGTFKPLDVFVPRLPDGAAAHVRWARLGIELLVGLRWADREPRPVAFSVRFCAAWCGLDHRHSNLAIRELVLRGVIHETDRSGRTPLYLPGEAEAGR